MSDQSKFNWTVKQDSKTKGAELYWDLAQNSENNTYMIRVFSYSDFDVISTFRAFADPKIRKTYDKNIDRYEINEKLGVNLYYLYQSTVRIGMVSSREVYYYC